MKPDWIVGEEICRAEMGGRCLIVDRWFYELIKRKRIYKSGRYLALRWGGKEISLHRMIMAHREGKIVDHKDTNTYNNRRENLRVVNRSQNAMNSNGHKDRDSPHRGVSYCKQTKKWETNLWLNGKHIYHKRYVNIQDAIDARVAAEKQYFGEYRMGAS